MIIFHMNDQFKTNLKINLDWFQVSHGVDKYNVIDKDTNKIRYEIPLYSILYVEYPSTEDESL